MGEQRHGENTTRRSKSQVLPFFNNLNEGRSLLARTRGEHESGMQTPQVRGGGGRIKALFFHRWKVGSLGKALSSACPLPGNSLSAFRGVMVGVRLALQIVWELDEACDCQLSATSLRQP